MGTESVKLVGDSFPAPSDGAVEYIAGGPGGPREVNPAPKVPKGERPKGKPVRRPSTVRTMVSTAQEPASTGVSGSVVEPPVPVVNLTATEPAPSAKVPSRKEKRLPPPLNVPGGVGETQATAPTPLIPRATQAKRSKKAKQASRDAIAPPTEPGILPTRSERTNDRRRAEGVGNEIYPVMDAIPVEKKTRPKETKRAPQWLPSDPLVPELKLPADMTDAELLATQKLFDQEMRRTGNPTRYKNLWAIERARRARLLKAAQAAPSPVADKKPSTASQAVTTMILAAAAPPGPLKILIPFLPQIAETFQTFTDAFPGIDVAFGTTLATGYVAMQSAAIALAKREEKPSFYYKTCPSAAIGAVWSGGTDAATPRDSWGCSTPINFSPPTVEGGDIRSRCNDDPLNCQHCGADVSQLTMMFGISERADEFHPNIVAAWCKRWGRVVTVVPNPAYRKFGVAVTAVVRTLGVAGDRSPIIIPKQYWYSNEVKYAMTGGGFLRMPSERLTWNFRPLGSAFSLVVFSLAKPGGGFIAGSMLEMAPTEVVGDGVFDNYNGVLVRAEVTNRVELSAAGAAASSNTYARCEKTASRVISELGESPHTRSGDEAKAAAEVAWTRINARNLSWLPTSFISELIWGRPGNYHGDTPWPYRYWHFGLAIVCLWLYSRRQKIILAHATIDALDTAGFHIVRPAEDIQAEAEMWRSARASAAYFESLRWEQRFWGHYHSSCFWFRRHLTVAPLLIVIALFVGPLSEEHLKHAYGRRFGLSAAAFIGLWESWRNSYQQGSYSAMPLVIHLLLSLVPFKFAVFYHMCFNLMAVTNPMFLLTLPPDLRFLTKPGLPGSLATTGWWAVVLISPFIEECAKHTTSQVLSLVSTILIIWWEYRRAWRVLGSAATAVYAPTALMHAVAALLPLPHALLLHVCFNLCAVTNNHQGCLPGSFALSVSTEFLATGKDTHGYPEGWVPPDVFRRQLPWTLRKDGLDGMYTFCCGTYMANCLDPIDTPQLNATPPPNQPTFCDAEDYGPYLDLIGVGVDCAIPIVFMSCVHNEGAALRLRLAAPVLWHDPLVTRFWGHIQTTFRASPLWERFRLEAGDNERIIPTCFPTWLRKYPQGQQLVLTEAREDSFKGIAKRDMDIKAFVKLERIPMLRKDAEAGKEKKPRLIQGRDPKVTSTTAPTMNALGNALKRACAGPLLDVVTYTGGLSAEEVGGLYSECVQAGLVPYSFDVQGWDASVGPGPTNSWGADVKHLRSNWQVRKLIDSRSNSKRGFTKHGWRYDLRFEVCSGDPDTTVGNSLNHMKIWLALYYDINGVSSAFAPGAHKHGFRVFVAGDNSIVMADPALLKELIPQAISIFRAAGFTLKAESTKSSIYHGIFCSGRMWAIGEDQYVFGPKIGRVVAKTFYCIHPLTTKTAKLKWLRGVAKGLQRNTAFIPVLRVIVDSILAATVRFATPSDKSNDDPWRVNATQDHEASPETWKQFCTLYSCSISEALRLESDLAKVTYDGCGTMFYHYLLDRIVAVDLA